MSGFWNNYIYYKKKELRKLQLYDISIERCEKFFFLSFTISTLCKLFII